MKNIFIHKIDINKVRHLRNIEITLSDSKRKHLILTGKNGSGKTSLLKELKIYLSGIENNDIYNIESWKGTLDLLNRQRDSIKPKTENEEDLVKNARLQENMTNF